MRPGISYYPQFMYSTSLDEAEMNDKLDELENEENAHYILRHILNKQKGKSLEKGWYNEKLNTNDCQMHYCDFVGQRQEFVSHKDCSELLDTNVSNSNSSLSDSFS
jgi:hypothetical protein